MKLVKLVVYCLLIVCLVGLIVIMSGEGETAVSAESAQLVSGLPGVTTALVASGFHRPSDIANAGDKRLFIAEQSGVIRIIDTDGTVLPTPFLDISERVSDNGNQGLLGLAFDPLFDDNGYFYVNYTHCSVPNTCPYANVPTPNLTTRISRFELLSDPYVADPDSEHIIMELSQPYPHHNGGDLNFGLDGYLYIGLGDGRDHYDPDNNAQNMGLMLGKILRIDIEGSSGAPPDCDPDGDYTIPNASGHFGNPFIDGPGGNCDEIWSLGLRNPWRFSFDRSTGSMFIADVGEDRWEEVNFQPANGGGENWGWRCFEGNHPAVDEDCGDVNELNFPFFEYPHSEGNQTTGCAVTGGYIYRGKNYPELEGYYFFADYCLSRSWMAKADGQGSWEVTHIGSLPGVDNVSTFGEDCNGEIYIADHLDGEIYQIQSTAAQFLQGGDEKNYIPVIFRAWATATALPEDTPFPTPTFTPSPTSISPDLCVN